MKSKIKILSAILVSSFLLYSACKKTSSAPSGPALTPQQVASQVAVNIDQSLFGGMGAFDFTSGINSPGTLAIHNNGKVINDLSNPTCGLSVDTTINTTLTQGDSTLSLKGTIKFGFACTNNVVSSFTTQDNVSIGYNSPSLKVAFQVGENLTVTALNPSDPNSNIQLDGSLNSTGSYQILSGSNKGSGTSLFDYTLKTVFLAGDGSEDVLSGTATFNTNGSGPRGNWNYQGTIVFQGNYTAVVTINGKTYTVNLQTGVVN